MKFRGGCFQWNVIANNVCSCSKPFKIMNPFDNIIWQNLCCEFLQRKTIAHTNNYACTKLYTQLCIQIHEHTYNIINQHFMGVKTSWRCQENMSHLTYARENNILFEILDRKLISIWSQSSILFPSK